MDEIVFDDPKIQYLNEKLDIILQEMSNFIKKLEADNKKEHEKMFENIDCLDSIITKSEAIIKRIDNKIDSLDSRLTKIDSDNKKEHHKIFENLDRIDTRITSLKSDNQEDHSKLSKHLDCLNSAFIRYKTDGIDKIKMLFDSDVDRKNHQDIYGHEFKRLHNIVAKISFRISNLEKNHSEN